MHRGNAPKGSAGDRLCFYTKFHTLRTISPLFDQHIFNHLSFLVNLNIYGIFVSDISNAIMIAPNFAVAAMFTRE